MTPDALSVRVIRVGVVFAVVAVLVQTVVHLVNVLLLDMRWPLLNADGDRGPFVWLSAVATFAVAFVALLLGLSGWRPRSSFLVAAVVAFFSLDDAVVIHERLGLRATGALGLPVEYARILWPVLYLPALALVVAAVALAARAASPQPRRALVAGLALLALAVAAEAASVVLVDSGEYLSSSAAYQLEVAFEEGAEAAGWIVLAAGLTAVLLETVLARHGAPRSDKASTARGGVAPAATAPSEPDPSEPDY